MTKNEYRLECLRRSPTFQKDVLSFHRKYPPVFVANHPAPLPRLPKWLEPLVQVKETAIIGNPKTLDALEKLLSFATECALTPYQRVWPEEGPLYFAVLGRSSLEKWSKDFTALNTKWGDVEPRSLRFPSTPLRVRPLLMAAGAELPKDVRIVIPIYAETTEAEKNEVWRLAMNAKRKIYSVQRTQRRSRPDKYEQRLRVFDAYERIKTFAGVTKELGIPSTTVKGLYLTACSGIYGNVPRGKAVKKRRTFGFHPAGHKTQCQQCQSAKRAEEMCAAAQTYYRQDHVSLREIQSSPELDSLVESDTQAPFRAGQVRNPEGSDRQFKEAYLPKQLTGRRTK